MNRNGRKLLTAASFTLIVILMSAISVGAWQSKVSNDGGSPLTFGVANIGGAFADGAPELWKADSDTVTTADTFYDTDGLCLLDDGLNFSGATELGGEAVKTGDLVLARMVFENTSNIPVYCRFKLDNVDTDAAYAVMIDDTADNYEISSGDFAGGDFLTYVGGDGGGWFYYPKLLEPNTSYVIWVAADMREVNDSWVDIGNPEMDLIQGTNNAVYFADGWKSAAGENGNFFIAD